MRSIDYELQRHVLIRGYEQVDAYATWYLPNTDVLPVGTQATVKTMTPEELKAMGSQVIFELIPTIILFLRPETRTLKEHGAYINL